MQFDSSWIGTTHLCRATCSDALDHDSHCRIIEFHRPRSVWIGSSRWLGPERLLSGECHLPEYF
jgi:hypothetical protein